MSSRNDSRLTSVFLCTLFSMCIIAGFDLRVTCPILMYFILLKRNTRRMEANEAFKEQNMLGIVSHVFKMRATFSKRIT